MKHVNQNHLRERPRGQQSEGKRLTVETGARKCDSERLRAESAETVAQLESVMDEAKASAEARGIVHVVDDDDGFATATCRLLRANGYATRRCADAGEFLLKDIPDAPGCILMDVYLPGPSGLELQAALAARQISLPIIFMSGRADVATSVRAMKGGAVDFLEKPIGRETLIQAVHGAIARSVEQRGLQQQLRRRQSCYASLTRRETEVFELVVAGKLNKEIAGELGAAERTIKAHRAQVMQKMRVSSVAELVHVAEQLTRSRPAAVPRASL
jgi:FixJ family two-component response regulator